MCSKIVIRAKIQELHLGAGSAGLYNLCARIRPGHGTLFVSPKGASSSDFAKTQFQFGASWGASVLSQNDVEERVAAVHTCVWSPHQSLNVIPEEKEKLDNTGAVAEDQASPSDVRPRCARLQ